MIRKIIAVLCLAAFLPSGAFAYWGFGGRLGGLTANNDDLQHEMDYGASPYSGLFSYSGDLSKTGGFAGLEAFYEGNGPSRFGLSVGLNSTGETKLTENGNDGASTAEFKASAQSVPVTLYWKSKAEDSNFSFRLGGGADFMKAVTKVKTNGGVDSEFKQSKVVPHVDAGVEWYMFKHVALGFNIGYLFGGKFDELKGTVNGSDAYLYTVPKTVGSSIGYADSQPAGTNKYVQDYSGVRADLSLRVYFGGN